MSDNPYRIPAARLDQAINVDPKRIGMRVGFAFAVGVGAFLAFEVLTDVVETSTKVLELVVITTPMSLVLVIFGRLWGRAAHRTPWHLPWVAALQGIASWVLVEVLIQFEHKLELGFRSPSWPLPPVLYSIGMMGLLALVCLMLGLAVRWRVNRALAGSAD